MNNDNFKEENQEKNNFESELEQQKKSLDTEKFAAQQERYKSMLPTDESFVDMNDPYAWRVGFGRRVGGYLIDNVFFIAFFMIAMMITGIAEEFMVIIPQDLSDMQGINNMMEFVNQRILPLSIAINFVYYSLEIFFAQTLGKMLLGIIIGTVDKKSATYSQLVVRFLVKELSMVFSLLFAITSLTVWQNLSSLAGFIIFIGSFLVLGAKRQAIHDSISKTAIYFKDELAQFDKNNSNN